MSPSSNDSSSACARSVPGPRPPPPAASSSFDKPKTKRKKRKRKKRDVINHPRQKTNKCSCHETQARTCCASYLYRARNTDTFPGFCGRGGGGLAAMARGLFVPEEDQQTHQFGHGRIRTLGEDMKPLILDKAENRERKKSCGIHSVVFEGGSSGKRAGGRAAGRATGARVMAVCRGPRAMAPGPAAAPPPPPAPHWLFPPLFHSFFFSFFYKLEDVGWGWQCYGTLPAACRAAVCSRPSAPGLHGGRPAAACLLLCLAVVVVITVAGWHNGCSGRQPACVRGQRAAAAPARARHTASCKALCR